MLFRSETPILYINSNGRVTKSIGKGTIVQAHGFCMDNDGNLWAGDSGPFRDDPSTRGRGFQIHKFSQDGELLMSLGRAGVSRADRANLFIGPTACTVAPNGNIIIADGHWPRPSDAQQDGDRLVVVTPAGEFVREVGRLGAGPGEFMGPHSLALDADGRLFVADRSNNRMQIFDRNLNFLDAWRHFGRPSGVTVLSDGTLGCLRLGIGLHDTWAGHRPGRGAERSSQPWLSGRDSGGRRRRVNTILHSGHPARGNGSGQLGQHLCRPYRRMRREPLRRMPAEMGTRELTLIAGRGKKKCGEGLRETSGN